jgi:hypothetical protein
MKSSLFQRLSKLNQRMVKVKMIDSTVFPTLRNRLNLRNIAFVSILLTSTSLAGLSSAANANSSIANSWHVHDKPHMIAQACDHIYLKPENRNLVFQTGQKWTTCNGYVFTFQGDGNLVLYSPSGTPIWATGTEGNGFTFVIQTDGNLVIYNKNNQPLWATDTQGNSNTRFAIQTDGNLVVYRGDQQPLWASHTVGGQSRTRSAAADWRAAKNPAPVKNETSGNQKAADFFAWVNGQPGIARRDAASFNWDTRGQCVTLVVRYLQDAYFNRSTAYRAYGDGKDMAAGVARQHADLFEPVTRNGLPKRGAIISFPGPLTQWGHVGIVMESRMSGNVRQIRMLESNGDNKGPNSTVRIGNWINIDGSNNGYAGVNGWTNPR